MAGTTEEIRKVLDRAGSTLDRAWQDAKGRIGRGGDGGAKRDPRGSTPPGRDQEPIADRPPFAPVAEPEATRDKPLPSSQADPERLRVDYADMTVGQLRDLAAERGIRGRSNMNKGALVSALQAADGDRSRTSGVAYADMTVEELRDLAAQRDIDGRSGMTKDELVEALQKS